MKRFTDTGKWADPWFRSLTPTNKLLFLWLVDNCDNAGVIDPDLMLAAFQIGDKVDEHNMSELVSRMQTLPNGKRWITKFVNFQFGPLSYDSRVHASVMRLLDSHGIQYPNDTISIAYVKGGDTTKDKDKDKDKDNVKDKDWIESLKKESVYQGINVDIELGKMIIWCQNQKPPKNPSRRRFINWLNRADRPMAINAPTVSREVSPSVAMMTNQKALERVEDRLKYLKGQFPLTDDKMKTEYTTLKADRARLMAALGFKA